MVRETDTERKAHSVSARETGPVSTQGAPAEPCGTSPAAAARLLTLTLPLFRVALLWSLARSPRSVSARVVAKDRRSELHLT